MTASGWAALAVLTLILDPSGASDRRAALQRAGRVGARETRPRTAGRPPPATSVAGLIGAAATAVVVGTAGPVLGVAVAASAGCGWIVVRDSLDGRRRAAGHAELLRACRLLVAELEVGSAPGPALDAAGGTAPGLCAVFGQASAALAEDRAAEVLCGYRPTRILGRAWEVSQRSGAPLAGVLGRVVADLVADDDRRRAVAVALAGPRASAVVLAGLPLLGVALGAALGASSVHILVGTPSGRWLCCAGMLFDAAGVWWIHAILRRAQGR